MNFLKPVVRIVGYPLALMISIGLSQWTGFRGYRIWKWFLVRLEK